MIFYWFRNDSLSTKIYFFKKDVFHKCYGVDHLSSWGVVKIAKKSPNYPLSGLVKVFFGRSPGKKWNRSFYRLGGKKNWEGENLHHRHQSSPAPPHPQMINGRPLWRIRNVIRFFLFSPNFPVCSDVSAHFAKIHRKNHNSIQLLLSTW